MVTVECVIIIVSDFSCFAQPAGLALTLLRFFVSGRHRDNLGQKPKDFQVGLGL